MAVRKLQITLAVLLCLLTAAPQAPAPPAVAAFGSGLSVCAPPVLPVPLENPTLVTDCTQTGLQASLDQGGQITFACGPNPVTIPLVSQLTLNPTVDTLLDGGGLVSLDGQGQTRILYKGWHDPLQAPSVTITLQNLRLVNGRAPSGGSTGDHSGGAIAAGHPGTRLHIINTAFENNRTRDWTTEDNQGGAIFLHNAYELAMSGVTFSGNQAGNGGAIGIIAAGAVIFNSVFDNNQALDDSAGGIVRGYGGAIHIDGVSNSYNPASSNRLHVCGSRFSANRAFRGGGAISTVISDNLGTLAIYERSVFEANQAAGQDESYGQGGALYHIEDDHAGGTNEDNLLVSQSLFHANSALRQGGGAWLYYLGRGRVVNSTFSANTTSAPFNTVGQGGGMAVTLGVLEIAHTTFAYNHAAYQAGALHAGGSGDPNRAVTLTHTIFLDNTLNEQTLPSTTEWQGYHTNRPLLDGGQNIQQPRYKPTYNNDVNNWITANPIFADPLLLPLAENGGHSQTHALAPASPAVNAAAGACPPEDQRLYPRLGACDLGAYEFGAAPFVASRFIYLPRVQRGP